MANSRLSHGLTTIDWVAIVLTVVGAVNWGLVGLFSFDLVAAIFGTMSVVSRLVYIVVAIAGIYVLALAATRFRSAPSSTTAATPSARL